MNFGPWELILLLYIIAVIAIPVIIIIWIIKTLSRIEKLLAGIEAKLDHLEKS